MSNNLSKQNASSTPGYLLLWRSLSLYRWRYVAAASALIASTVFQFAVPLIGSATIDFALDANSERTNPLLRTIADLLGGPAAIGSNLWIPALAMVGFAAIGGLFNYIQRRQAAIASDSICRQMKDQLYDHIQRLKSRYIDQAASGDLVQRCTSDIETSRLFLANQVVEIGRGVVLILAVLPIMLAMHPRLTLVSTVLIPVIVGYGYFYFKRVKTIFKEVDEAEGQLTSVIQENITGIRVVRAFGRHRHEIEKFAKPNREYRDANIQLIRLMSLFWAPSDFLNHSQIGLALVYGSYLAIAGQITIGTLFAFLALLGIVLWPVRMLGRILTEFGKTTVALQRIHEILNEPFETQDDTPTLHPQKPVEGRIAFHSVTFAHNANSPTVEDISFELAPGQTLAILGPSGGGKSTLMHLLLRFFDPDTGSIELDGMDLKSLDRQYARSQFGVVLQEPFLYSRPILENIRFGSQTASDAEIELAARTACIHETITEFPDGYRTEIGERGIVLSGGQRQRVALSRALLGDPPVLLLDDALSAVDNETESAIIDALKARHGKRTTIVIAHRLSTLTHADQIIVLDKGRITQMGTHQSLAKEPGLYKRLWDIQTQLEDQFQTEAATT